MADEFQLVSGNWRDSTRIESGSSSSPTSAAAVLNTRTTSTTISVGSYGWLTQVVNRKVGGGGSLPEAAAPRDHGILTDNSNLQMMGLGQSSQGMDNWNQPLSLMRSEKGDESSFGRMLEEDDDELRCSNSISTISNFEQEQWSTRSHDHTHSAARRNCDDEEEDSSPRRLFSLHQSHLITGSHHRILNPSDHDTNPNAVVFTCPTATTFQIDSSIYDYPNNNPPSSTSINMLQGLLGFNNWLQQQSMINNYSSYGIIKSSSSSGAGDHYHRRHHHHHHHQPLILQPNSSWSKPPAQNQLQFSNNADPFWNASTAAAASSNQLLPNSLQMQLPSSTFDEKAKNISGDLSTVGKKSDSSSEPSTKRPRNGTPSPLPPFKVRKEKMGDRITALQQLVSPFGKTDTASVLSEAIEYINFLHEQVGALSNPYMKSGAPIQQEDCDKDREGEEQDLRNRGLCLVPVSSTFPVTHETTVDFWNPTFGGTF